MKRVLPAVLFAVACSSPAEPPPAMPSPQASGSAAPIVPPATHKYDALARAEFNRWAVRLNAPVYWIEDKNHDGAIDPDEVASLLFYPTEGRWSSASAFTPEFESTYESIVAAAKAPPPAQKSEEDKRRALVGQISIRVARRSCARTSASCRPTTRRSCATCSWPRADRRPLRASERRHRARAARPGR